MPDAVLHVEFDQPQEVFFPGYPISGKVRLSVDGDYKARAVNIKFEGLAHTNWSISERHTRRGANGETEVYHRTVNYSLNVNYLDHCQLLWASSDGSNILKEGSYEWPFSVILAGNVPPSFEGKYGYIRYSVTAEVDRPWRFDKAKKRCITVSPFIDLNALPYSIAPLHDQANENLGCCCFKKGRLELRVDIPKTGFVPGEVVPINLNILNYSSVPVIEAKAKIIQNCTFVAFRNGHNMKFVGESSVVLSDRETKTDSKTVVKETQKIDVAPRTEQRIVLELRLPSVNPTINQNSPAITVEYLVQVTIDTSATFSSDIDCEMGLLIGTVPIRQYLPPTYYPQYPGLPPTAGLPPFGFAPNFGGGDVPGYPMPPPYPEPQAGDGSVAVPSAPPISYEDSMYGSEGTELNKDENEKPFVPKYPVFNDLPVYNPTAPPKE